MNWNAVLHHRRSNGWFSFATIRNGLSYLLLGAMVDNYYPHGWLRAGEDADALSRAFCPTGQAGLRPGER